MKWIVGLLAFAALSTSAAAASASTFYEGGATGTISQIDFQIVDVGGQRETQTTFSVTNTAGVAQYLGATWISRILNGQASSWNQADLAFEVGGLSAKPDVSTYYAVDASDTDIVPPFSGVVPAGDSLAFFDFGQFAPGQTKQETAIFFVSPSLTGISGSLYLVSRTPVPEHATWAMTLAGLGLVGAAMRLRRGQGVIA